MTSKNHFDHITEKEHTQMNEPMISMVVPSKRVRRSVMLTNTSGVSVVFFEAVQVSRKIVKLLFVQH